MGPSSKTADMVFRQTFKFRGDKKNIQWFPGNICSQVNHPIVVSFNPSVCHSLQNQISVGWKYKSLTLRLKIQVLLRVNASCWNQGCSQVTKKIVRVFPIKIRGCTSRDLVRTGATCASAPSEIWCWMRRNYPSLLRTMCLSWRLSKKIIEQYLHTDSFEKCTSKSILMPSA